MMKKISIDTVFFFNKWDKDRENSWSGTPMGLCRALSKMALGFSPIDLNYGFFCDFFIKIVHLFQYLFSVNGCGLIERYIEGNLQNCYFKNNSKNGPVIAFSEAKTLKIEDTYYFIDCSVNYSYRCIKSQYSFSQYLPLYSHRRFSLLDKRNELALQCYKRCKGIFTMGQWIAEDLIDNTNLPAEKVHCVGGGINVKEQLVDCSRKEGKRFLFVGKDFQRKNGPLVVSAFKLLSSLYSYSYDLYIAGPRCWPLDEDIPSNVHFLGHLTSEELVKYYNLCDVFVMPSAFEAYGLVFAEALVFGLPVIARDAFSMKEFVKPGENGYLLKDNSAEELASLMYKAISNFEMRKHVIDRRKEYAKYYSWDTVASRILDVMRKDGYEV